MPFKPGDYIPKRIRYRVESDRGELLEEFGSEIAAQRAARRHCSPDQSQRVIRVRRVHPDKSPRCVLVFIATWDDGAEKVLGCETYRVEVW